MEQGEVLLTIRQTGQRKDPLWRRKRTLSSICSTSSGQAMNDLVTENCDIHILDNGRTVNDFIDSKIKELDSTDIEEPFYAANLDSLFQRHLRWISNLPRVKPFYAVKCNNTPVVLKMLSTLDTGFDCASKGEIELALSLGVTPEQIIFAHTTKPQSHIKYACTHGVNMMTFDNEDELLKISLCHPKAKLVLRIAVDDSKSFLRLSLKFGAKLSSARRLLERAAELELEVIGVSFHVGCECTEILAFKQAIADARHVFDMGNLMGFQMKLLDIGGGFSGRDDFPVKFEEVAEVINGALEEFFPPDSGVEVIAEPGRYFVESALTLVAKIIAKTSNIDDVDDLDDPADMEKKSCDRTMAYYLNEGVYGSLNVLIIDPEHCRVEPYLHRVVTNSEQKYRSILWGPTCDSADKISDSKWFPEMFVGDSILVDNMGAYTYTVSTTFNGYGKVHVYPVMSADTWHKLNLLGFH